MFFMEIRNIGDEALSDIRLSSDGPEGWTIRFEPDEIDYLGAGSQNTVDVIIRPDDGTVGGDYQITIIAEAEEVRKVTTMWIEVATSPLWLWIGGIVVAVVIAAFICMFWRLNKRSQEQSDKEVHYD